MTADCSFLDLLQQHDVAVRIFACCPEIFRFRLMVLNQVTLANFYKDELFWKHLCELMASESCLYCPRSSQSRTWKQMYQFLSSIQSTFVSQPQKCDRSNDMLTCGGATKTRTSFNIKVFTRVRPSSSRSTGASVFSHAAANHMILPLHQRLKLIATQQKCSKAEARKLLWQNKGEKFDPWEHAFIKENTQRSCDCGVDNKISKVQDEIEACLVSVGAGRQGSVLMCCPGTGLRDFQFDEVFDESAQQSQVYDSCASELVCDFMNGRNACIFAYGQTGSGKTHTIFGPDLHSATNVGRVQEESSGLVPRLSKQILTAVAMRNNEQLCCELFLSYVEVFGDQVSNLLKDNRPVGTWHGVAHRAVFLDDCAVKIEGEEHLSRLLRAGDEAKRRAATAMNERSTRAHNLIFFLCKQVVKQTETEVSSHFCIADLGGSEQVFKSEVASLSKARGGYVVKDERFQEACNINLGLLALKTCIRSLVRNSENVQTDLSYVPFQDSRLTMLLSSALGGNCRTAVVISVSPETRNAVETLHSLRFGEECSQVVLRSLDSVAAATQALKALDQRIREVEEEIRGKERWETVRSLRKDALHQDDEATQQMEVVTTSRLVGAETERSILEGLLARRKAITGEER